MKTCHVKFRFVRYFIVIFLFAGVSSSSYFHALGQDDVSEQKNTQKVKLCDAIWTRNSWLLEVALKANRNALDKEFDVEMVRVVIENREFVVPARPFSRSEFVLEAKRWKREYDEDVLLYREFTPVLLAIRLRDEDTLKRLLAAGADPNYADSYMGGYFEAALEDQFLKGARILLTDKDFDPDLRASQTGNTPLVAAVIWRRPDLVALLLEKGANPSLGTKNYVLGPFHPNRPTEIRRPIHLLAQGTKRSLLVGSTYARDVKILDLLLKHGADINARVKLKSGEGATVLDLARKHNHELLDALVKRGAKDVHTKL